MWKWWRSRTTTQPPGSVEEKIRFKYSSFRELLSLNNESLELMAGLQEDLQFVPPRRDILDARVLAIFEKVEGVVAALEKLSGVPQPVLLASLHEQQHAVERYAATLQEFSTPRLSAWLHEVGADAVAEVGGKAALLGEIRKELGMPVPDGYVLTTEAYRQFCGIPLWTAIRDALRKLDFSDLEALQAISAGLVRRVMECPVPRSVEVAITERAHAMLKTASGLAVRSSAVGEGGARTYAGQFTSLLNVAPEDLVDAYRRVVAGRFSDRALFYRLSSGLLEADSPMAVLFLPILDARASGIMYTRDPSDPKSKTLWITATRGLGVDIASGRAPADLFILERHAPHRAVERHIAHKEDEVALEAGGGIARRAVSAASADEPSLKDAQLDRLAGWGVRIEEHFKTPQDIEWVLDPRGELWIVQSRPLALTESAKSRSRIRVKEEPRLSGGRTIHPGRISGPAYLLEDSQAIRRAPAGSIVFARRPSPEMVEILPRIAGLVAEWGNVAGHVAALLREYRVPSVFQMTGAFERLKSGETVSLDAVQSAVYAGTLWPPRRPGHLLIGQRARDRSDPISQRLLALNLLDPAGANFRPSGCKSAHDVLRYCHEKAIGAMFEVGDLVHEKELSYTRRLVTELPLNVQVLDLGGGLSHLDPESRQVNPSEIVSRPFQSLWRGITHPGVSWRREMPASFSDLAAVIASALTPRSEPVRALGEKSYLLVAQTHMNLNSRLAYHFSLVDASVSETPSENYITFRFEGGGTTHERRNLRACFIERCLAHHDYHVDRRGDLVNAWYRKSPAAVMEEKLDILGRLLGCSSQLDMFMTSDEVMRWYVKQFTEGNYSLRDPAGKA
ncbi:MAG: hypothetical protein HY822_15370 [Acidobacteria bacterium]|nr:hypothetical protein [Acidobacteriota bacterium]